MYSHGSGYDWESIVDLSLVFRIYLYLWRRLSCHVLDINFVRNFEVVLQVTEFQFHTITVTIQWRLVLCGGVLVNSTGRFKMVLRHRHKQDCQLSTIYCYCVVSKFRSDSVKHLRPMSAGPWMRSTWMSSETEKNRVFYTYAFIVPSLFRSNSIVVDTWASSAPFVNILILFLSCRSFQLSPCVVFCLT